MGKIHLLLLIILMNGLCVHTASANRPCNCVLIGSRCICVLTDAKCKCGNVLISNGDVSTSSGILSLACDDNTTRNGYENWQCPKQGNNPCDSVPKCKETETTAASASTKQNTTSFVETTSSPFSDSTTPTETTTSSASTEQGTTSIVETTSLLTRATTTLESTEESTNSSVGTTSSSINNSTTLTENTTSSASTTQDNTSSVSTTTSSESVPNDTGSTTAIESITESESISTDDNTSGTTTSSGNTESSTASTEIISNKQAVSDDGNKAVVVAIPVTVSFVVVVILVIVYMWRRKSGKKCLGFCERHSEKSTIPVIHNLGYENSSLRTFHGSLNEEHSESVDSGNADIPMDNIRSEDATVNIYQTIDDPKRKTSATDNDYGHVKKPSAPFMDNTYSHLNGDQTLRPVLTDMTYSHTVNPQNNDKLVDPSLKSETDNTYNHLGPNPRASSRCDIRRFKTPKEDTVYNHATAGNSTCPRQNNSDNSTDTNSHIDGSRTRPSQQPATTLDTSLKSRSQVNQATGNLHKATEDAPYEFAKECDAFQYEFAKDVQAPEYAVVNKRNVRSDLRTASRSNDYERPVGTPNAYIELVPDNDPGNSETSFIIADERTKVPVDNESEETTDHHYFTLEKQ